MEKNTRFTNEELARKFKSNFDAVNYAIQLATNMIQSGRDARIKSDMQNRAILVLEEILQGVDRFDNVSEVDSLSKERRREQEELLDRESRFAMVFENKIQESSKSKTTFDDTDKE